MQRLISNDTTFMQILSGRTVPLILYNMNVLSRDSLISQSDCPSVLWGSWNIYKEINVVMDSLPRLILLNQLSNFYSCADCSTFWIAYCVIYLVRHFLLASMELHILTNSQNSSCKRPSSEALNRLFWPRKSLQSLPMTLIKHYESRLCHAKRGGYSIK